MLVAQLEDRFREAIGASPGERDESVHFAVDFTRLLARILTEHDLGARAREAMKAAIDARTDLSGPEIDVLLDMALAPETRVPIDDDDLRAFGTRFGHAEEEALRAAVAEEIDLPGFAERYGEAESLLLLDSLFQVCAVDGRIDRRRRFTPGR